jgi:hypothetical protein
MVSRRVGDYCQQIRIGKLERYWKPTIGDGYYYMEKLETS